MTNDLFNRIAAFIPTAQGWCSVEKAQALASVIVALRPDVSCEVGVFAGRGATVMAMAHQHIGHGVCVAIDPWAPSESVSGQDAANADWWGKLNHEAIYQEFLMHVGAQGVRAHLNIHRASSNDITPPEGLGLAVLDGNHGPQAIIDAQRYGAACKIGAVCLLDDLSWSGGHVTKAVEVLLSLGFDELYRVKNDNEEWAAFQRVRA